MAIETANFVHALAVFVSANPPTVEGLHGVRSVTRVSAGFFRLQLVEPLAPADGLCQATLGPAFNSMIACVINNDGEVEVTTYLQGDIVATPADGGRVQLVVCRLPTVR